MKRFKKILAVYNDVVGAEDALIQAVALAKANKARLTLVDVIPPSAAMSEARQEREKRLRRVAGQLRGDGISRLSSKVLAGPEPAAIVREVEDSKHDIVIASAEGGSMLRNAVYGRMSTQLIRKCPCPVWLLKPGHGLRRGRVLAAVDPDPKRPETEALNVKIMDMATSLAKSYEAQIHVVHAWDIWDGDRVTLQTELPDSTRTALVNKHRRYHKKKLKALLADYAVPPRAVHLPRSNPEPAILKTVREQDIDLIVIGTSTRPGLTGFLMSNSAEYILSAVHGGILAVKDDAPARANAEEKLATAA